MQVAPEFAAASVLDPDGSAHSIGSLWAEKPAVLVFIRHFG